MSILKELQQLRELRNLASTSSYLSLDSLGRMHYGTYEGYYFQNTINLYRKWRPELSQL